MRDVDILSGKCTTLDEMENHATANILFIFLPVFLLQLQCDGGEVSHLKRDKSRHATSGRLCLYLSLLTSHIRNSFQAIVQ